MIMIIPNIKQLENKRSMMMIISRNKPCRLQRHDRRLSAHLNNDDDKRSGAEIGNKKGNTGFLLSGISSMNHVLSRAQIDLDHDDLSG